MKNDKDKCILGVIYRPPNSPTDTLNSILNPIEQAMIHDNVIIVGDLNYNYITGDTLCNDPAHLIEYVNNLNQIIMSPTRVTKNSSTMLDLIYVSNTLFDRIINSGVIDNSMSDHHPVYVCFDFNHSSSNSHNDIIYTDYKHFSSKAFLADIQTCNILTNENSLKNNDLNTNWENWKSTFLSIVKKHAPRKKARLKVRCNPWINNETVNLIYKRDNLKKKFNKTKQAVYMDQYREIRNAINKLIRTKKREYFLNKINDNRNDPKKMSKLLRDITCKKPNPPPDELTHNEFNDYFSTSSVGTNTVNAILDKKSLSRMEGAKITV